MNATQAENLRILIRHMENNVTRTLDMKTVEKCGTAACALGEAKLVCSGLREQFDSRNPYIDANRIFGCYVEPLDLKEGSWDYKRIFGSYLHNKIDVSPHEWAAEARLVLAENGYAMDADTWAADKVRELVKPKPMDAELPSVREVIEQQKRIASHR